MRRLDILRRVILLAGFLACSACSPATEYSHGRSKSDIPHNVHTVALKQIYMVAEGLPESKKFRNGEPIAEESPSENDQEVIALVKSAMLQQLRKSGYIVMDGQNSNADVGLKVFVDYFPERWPLLDRTLSIRVHVHDTTGTLIFKTYTYRLTAGIIDAVTGPDRDGFVEAAARESAIKTIRELKTGIKK